MPTQESMDEIKITTPISIRDKVISIVEKNAENPIRYYDVIMTTLEDVILELAVAHIEPVTAEKKHIRMLISRDDFLKKVKQNLCDTIEPDDNVLKKALVGVIGKRGHLEHLGTVYFKRMQKDKHPLWEGCHIRYHGRYCDDHSQKIEFIIERPDSEEDIHNFCQSCLHRKNDSIFRKYFVLFPDDKKWISPGVGCSQQYLHYCIIHESAYLYKLIGEPSMSEYIYSYFSIN